MKKNMGQTTTHHVGVNLRTGQLTSHTLIISTPCCTAAPPRLSPFCLQTPPRNPTWYLFNGDIHPPLPPPAHRIHAWRASPCPDPRLGRRRVACPCVPSSLAAFGRPSLHCAPRWVSTVLEVSYSLSRLIHSYDAATTMARIIPYQSRGNRCLVLGTYNVMNTGRFADSELVGVPRRLTQSPLLISIRIRNTR